MIAMIWKKNKKWKEMIAMIWKLCHLRILTILEFFSMIMILNWYLLAFHFHIFIFLYLLYCFISTLKWQVAWVGGVSHLHGCVVWWGCEAELNDEGDNIELIDEDDKAHVNKLNLS